MSAAWSWTSRRPSHARGERGGEHLRHPDDISAGTYSGAAFQVLIWTGPTARSISIDTLDSGTIEAGDGEPDMLAYAYVLFDGEASFPLDGEGGEVIVNYIELGNYFEGRVNLDTFDLGAEGNFNACYSDVEPGYARRAAGRRDRRTTAPAQTRIASTRTASVACFYSLRGGLTAPTVRWGLREGFERDDDGRCTASSGAVPTMRTSTTRSSMTFHRITSALTSTTAPPRCVRSSPFSACVCPLTDLRPWLRHRRRLSRHRWRALLCDDDGICGPEEISPRR